MRCKPGRSWETEAPGSGGKNDAGRESQVQVKDEWLLESSQHSEVGDQGCELNQGDRNQR